MERLLEAAKAGWLKGKFGKVAHKFQKHNSLQVQLYSRLPLQPYQLQCPAKVPSQNGLLYQSQSPQHHHRLFPLLPPPFSSLVIPVLLLIPALLSASNLSIPSLVACNTLSCLSHIAKGRLGCAINSSAPSAFPDGECTIPPFRAFSEINCCEEDRVRDGELR